MKRVKRKRLPFAIAVLVALFLELLSPSSSAFASSTSLNAVAVLRIPLVATSPLGGDGGYFAASMPFLSLPYGKEEHSLTNAFHTIPGNQIQVSVRSLPSSNRVPSTTLYFREAGKWSFGAANATIARGQAFSVSGHLTDPTNFWVYAGLVPTNSPTMLFATNMSTQQEAFFGYPYPVDVLFTQTAMYQVIDQLTGTVTLSLWDIAEGTLISFSKNSRGSWGLGISTQVISAAAYISYTRATTYLADQTNAFFLEPKPYEWP